MVAYCFPRSRVSRHIFFSSVFPHCNAVIFFSSLTFSPSFSLLRGVFFAPCILFIHNCAFPSQYQGSRAVPVVVANWYENKPWTREKTLRKMWSCAKIWNGIETRKRQRSEKDVHDGQLRETINKQQNSLKLRKVEGATKGCRRPHRRARPIDWWANGASGPATAAWVLCDNSSDS